MVVSFGMLIPFAMLYLRRGTSLDAVQALEASHRPDLFRLPEVLAFAVLLLLAWLVKQKPASARDVKYLFAASFALLPFLVFNQQVISGRSLQPLHYEMFVANYSALIALVLVLGHWFRMPALQSARWRRKVLLWVAIAAFEWGSYETFVATRRSAEFDRRLDEARPVALRMAQLAQAQNSSPQTVLASDLLAADGLPTSAPQAVLWAPHILVYSGVTPTESKERFYQYLYYTGIGADRLRQILKTERQYGFAAGLFGFERTIKGLSLNPKPITAEELENELSLYAQYCSSFTRERAAQTELSYLTMPVDDERDVTNLDRWYERDGGERIGSYTLYRLKLRNSNAFTNGQPAQTSLQR